LRSFSPNLAKIMQSKTQYDQSNEPLKSVIVGSGSKPVGSVDFRYID